jgi:molybdopterin converting factor small subunit
MLVEKHGSRMRDYLFDEAGKPRAHLQFFLNDKSIHLINGLETALRDDSTLAIVPPVSGG